MNQRLSRSRRMFASLVRRRDDRLDLAMAALLLAQEEYPDLSIEEYLLRLDQMAAEMQYEVNLDLDPASVAQGIGRFMAREREFMGNSEDYYDPRNSYLNDVIDRRLGIPITLSLLYIEVARRAGVKLLPVSFPGHFLVKFDIDGIELFLDPFGGGRVLDVAGCRRLLALQYGESARFSESMLGAATKRQVLSRMLMNLKYIYLRKRDHARALRTVDQLLTISPWDLEQLRDRGLLYYELGEPALAQADLQAYAEHAPPGSDLDAVHETLRRLT